MEQFKQCLFSDSHLIGDNGTVKRTDQRSINRFKTDVLTGLIKEDGYKMYYINYKWNYGHRLVAQHFIDNPNDWKEINHIDGNKINNHVSNLEWSTRKLNHKHRIEVLGNYGQGRPKGSKTSEAGKLAMSKAKLGRKRDGNGGKWL